MPEPFQRVISNATPLINLSLIKQLGLLNQLYGEVLMPPAVRAELLAGGPGRAGVTDVPRARAFYEGVLGLKPAQVIDLPNGQWVEYEVGASTLTLGSAPGWKPSPDGCSVALDVADFDSAVAHLRAQGAKFRLEPFATPVCQMAMVFDPDGNTVCIHKRKAK